MKSKGKFALASLIKNQSRPLRDRALVRRSTTPLPSRLARPRPRSTPGGASARDPLCPSQ
ncbi:hypothetical protein BMG03_01010 [Thioclava nitratireducens]|uniref:Uncharacterized protein n=1 Tax=Thioclava nitratireducens TaxID=1915078 RepID=A0ABM6ICU8_9RHOB|nr:hypothetical protein BMG03_01010 [Thioclava nitratireducens]